MPVETTRRQSAIQLLVIEGDKYGYSKKYPAGIARKFRTDPHATHEKTYRQSKPRENYENRPNSRLQNRQTARIKRYRNRRSQQQVVRRARLQVLYLQFGAYWFRSNSHKDTASPLT